MKSTLRRALAALGFLVALAVPAFGHHSFAAEFDQDKPIAITGTLTKVDWINPHIYMYVDAKDAGGNPVTWAFESLPPNWFHKMGLERKAFTIGETVTISGYAAKDGSKALGWIKKVKFSDGREIQITSDNPNENAK